MPFGFVHKRLLAGAEAARATLERKLGKARARLAVAEANVAAEVARRQAAEEYARSLVDRLLEKNGIRPVESEPETHIPGRPAEMVDSFLESLTDYQTRMERFEAEAIQRFGALTPEAIAEMERLREAQPHLP